MKPLTLRQLCSRYTRLSNKDIEMLESMAAQLIYISDITGTDIFIDALSANGVDAIVLAWASPATGRSLYKQSVVGQMAYALSEPAVHKTLTTGEKSINVRGVSQEGIPIAQTVVPIFNAEKVIGVLIMEKDISEELRQQEHVQFLSQTAERLSNTLIYLSTTGSKFEDWLGNGIFVLNKTGKITYANKAAVEMYQTSSGINPLGHDFSFSIINCESLEQLLETFKNPVELTILNKCYLLQAHPLFTYAEISGCVISFQDITDLRRKEQELDAQSTIIREIHHRVKNNLQNVAALLRLQMRRSESELVRTEFAASINRIISIATVHEVFALQSWDAIDLIELSSRILKSLLESSALPEHQINTILEGHHVQLPSKQAVPLALVINELLTNSLKHGLAQVEEGEIVIKIVEGQEDIKIYISDNGPGIKEMKRLEDSNRHLGLQIVDSLIVDQLGGVFRLERDQEKTRAIVCFPK